MIDLYHASRVDTEEVNLRFYGVLRSFGVASRPQVSRRDLIKLSPTCRRKIDAVAVDFTSGSARLRTKQFRRERSSRFSSFVQKSAPELVSRPRKVADRRENSQ